MGLGSTLQNKDFVEMTPSWNSMEKSYDFPTLPTMAWIPLRGIHIPTKPAVIFFIIKNKRLKPVFTFESMTQRIDDAKQNVLNITSRMPYAG